MSEMKTAAIIGGGVIGGGWAARFLLAGWNVHVFDTDTESERKINEVLTNARRSLPALYDHILPDEGKLTFCDSIEAAVQNAAWIQESIPERIELKHAVLNEIQTHCSKDAIIGSSTSGYKPSELRDGALNPEQIIVAHPFNPVYLIPLVEIVGHSDREERALEILTEIGMKPLIVRKEIEGHIADRFLEAVWREGLWLINDDVATTQEIDDAIRFGFGLRWAQMGLFETYRIAGGEAGMQHFIQQFGPALQWPWTKLMDVPELTDELVDKIANQSDAQSGHYTIRELEQIRDDNLVAMMRALKSRNWGAGELLNTQDKGLKKPGGKDLSQPVITINRRVPVDWTDYNGHMNESRYGQVFSDAADRVMDMVGADKAYIEAGNSYFTVDTHTSFIDECKQGDQIINHSTILMFEGKKLKLAHELKAASGETLATCEQLLIHVNLHTRKSSAPVGAVHQKQEDFNSAKVTQTHSEPAQ